MRYKLVLSWGQQVAVATTLLAVLTCGSAAAQGPRPKDRPADVPLSVRITETSKRPAAEETGTIDSGQPAPAAEPIPTDVPKSDPQPIPTDPQPAPPEKPKTDAPPGKTDAPPGKADAPPADIDDAAAAEGAAKEGESKKPGDEESLKPVPNPDEAGPAPIEAASFKGVTPGVTTMAEVEKAWGPPKEINKQHGVVVQLFAVEPFDRIEVSYFEDKVASVIIRFNRAFAADAVAKQLELTNVRPVLVSNDLGEILGQAYPERGVLFAFQPNSEDPKKPSLKVAHIILEPISAEPFVLRAETNLESHTKASLLDLEQALKLQPNNARAQWLYSRAMTAKGEFDSALASSTQAVRLEPDNPKYHVTRAQILGQMGRVTEAIQEARKALDTSKSRPHVLARAQCLLGDLLASGSKPDYKQAIRFHMDAVKTADPLTKQPHPAVRIAAKEVLIDAHLGAAHDIAWGDWKDKEPAVTRWLTRATELADDLVKNEGGSEDQRFRAHARALAACVGMRGVVDPGQWAKHAAQIGEELVNSARDPVHKAQVQWDLGMALYDALQVYQMRGDHDTALRCGEAAVEYLEQGDRLRQSSASAYLLGRLYFRLGAIHAIRDKNHRAAITWFEKAIPLLEKPIPKEDLADLGRHGETFVSMGVSYWESGQRERAVELTQQGVKLMEQAVKQGSLAETALAIPYSNMASMHRQLGAKADAARFQEMSARIKKSKVQ